MKFVSYCREKDTVFDKEQVFFDVTGSAVKSLNTATVKQEGFALTLLLSLDD